ncbi:MAG: bifunctional [glutamate--ammonia ligase]-adenylyl-L-tyrosine phosphorylase/[glutamate--ammonia-ligase] adenylyltransferase, partial [Shewanella sp.]
MTTAKDTNPSLPTVITQAAQRHWQRLEEVWSAGLGQLTADAQQELSTILGLSDYVASQLCRHPEWIHPLLTTDLKQLDRKTYGIDLPELLASATTEEAARAVLRRFRNYQMVRLAWRDWLDYGSLEESLLDLSALAEALVIGARDWLYQDMCAQYGTPMDKAGNPQPLLILGMGKLGGRELNFSSDIDLIFTFPEHGETVGGRRSLDNQQFFIRMGQRLVNLLDQITVDGFVFRVDMRLRPYGESGPLVVSFSGLEDYYQEQGRDWERYAMVKARALGPWSHYSDELHALLRPFVYRRYIDFSAIESLRKMKQLIAQEVR